jgi:hypothetical protein
MAKSNKIPHPELLASLRWHTCEEAAFYLRVNRGTLAKLPIPKHMVQVPDSPRKLPRYDRLELDAYLLGRNLPSEEGTDYKTTDDYYPNPEPKALKR